MVEGYFVVTDYYAVLSSQDKVVLFVDLEADVDGTNIKKQHLRKII
jgi:hypothetical protein